MLNLLIFNVKTSLTFLFNFKMFNFSKLLNTYQYCWQASVIGASIWMSDWSEDGDLLSTEEFRSQIGLRLGVYGALGGAQGFRNLNMFLNFTHL